jgi:hypothetical protein
MRANDARWRVAWPCLLALAAGAGSVGCLVFDGRVAKATDDGAAPDEASVGRDSGDEDSASNDSAGNDSASNDSASRDSASSDGGAEASADPFSYVQGQNANVQNPSTPTLTLTVAFNNPVAANTTFVVAFDCDNNLTVAAVAPVTDTLGNSFQQAVGPAQTFDVSGYIFVAHNTKGTGHDSITVALQGASSGPSNFEVFIHEYAGIATFDKGNVGGGNSLMTDGIAGALTPASTPELIFAYGYALSDVSHGTIMGGSNMRVEQAAGWAISEDRVTTMPGMAAAAATMTSGTDGTLLVAAFTGL